MNGQVFFNPDDDEAWNHETGAPGVSLFANAIQVWATMQPEGKPASVWDASRAFNCTPAMITAAVEWHYYMYLEGDNFDPTKQFICHEGE